MEAFVGGFSAVISYGFLGTPTTCLAHPGGQGHLEQSGTMAPSHSLGSPGGWTFGFWKIRHRHAGSSDNLDVMNWPRKLGWLGKHSSDD